MIVRDRTLSPKEYKGRETSACDRECPCRACFNAHDCGAYSTMGKWLTSMQCATRYNGGCPTTTPRPRHVYVSDRGKVCLRCGARREIRQQLPGTTQAGGEASEPEGDGG